MNQRGGHFPINTSSSSSDHQGEVIGDYYYDISRSISGDPGDLSGHCPPSPEKIRSYAAADPNNDLLRMRSVSESSDVVDFYHTQEGDVETGLSTMAGSKGLATSSRSNTNTYSAKTVSDTMDAHIIVDQTSARNSKSKAYHQLIIGDREKLVGWLAVKMELQQVLGCQLGCVVGCSDG
eukprot:gene26716-33338_t